jgi:RsiW-degrading membrane proteinase PrsW (M82 family)
MNGYVLPQASLFLGIIPALILLYLSLKGYEGYYKDKNIFLTFVIGIILGFISCLFEIFTIGIGLLFIILFPIFEQLFKTIILNTGRFHGKKETVIYGLSLGLGFGSIFTPLSLIISNIQTSDDISIIISLIIGSIGIILVHGATGIIIGYGIFSGTLKKYLFSGTLKKYLLFAIFLHFPVTSWFFLTDFFDIEYLQFVLILYGFVIYWYSTKKIMPHILSQSNRIKRMKKI